MLLNTVLFHFVWKICGNKLCSQGGSACSNICLQHGWILQKTVSPNMLCLALDFHSLQYFFSFNKHANCSGHAVLISTLGWTWEMGIVGQWRQSPRTEGGSWITLTLQRVSELSCSAQGQEGHQCPGNASPAGWERWSFSSALMRLIWRSVFSARLCSVRHEHAGVSPAKSHKDGSGPGVSVRAWSICHKKRLRKLELFSLDKVELRGIYLCAWTGVTATEPDSALWCQASSQVAVGTDKHQKFHLNIRKICF